MHQPAPVAVTCSGGGAWRGVQAGCWAATAVVLVGWAAQLARLDDHIGSAVLWALASLVGALVLAVAWRAQRPRPAQLQWDGQVWRLDGDPGRVSVMLDLQRWLLLRFDADSDAGHAAASRRRWLPLPDHEAGGQRQALRAALYSRAALNPPSAPVTPPSQRPPD